MHTNNIYTAQALRGNILLLVATFLLLGVRWMIKSIMTPRQLTPQHENDLYERV